MKGYLLIKRYFAALNHYKWYGIGCFALVLAIAGGLATRLAKSENTYVAQGTLIYQPTNEAAAKSPSTSQKSDGTALPMQLSVVTKEALTSDLLLQLTSKTLKAKRVAIAPATLRSQIKVEADPKQEHRFLVYHQDDDAQKAKLIVESFVNTVSDQSLADKRQQVVASIKFLEKRKDLLEDKLQVAEEKLRDFSRREKPAIQAAIDGSLVSAITNIQQQQRQLRREIEGINAEIVSLQGRLGMTPEQAYIASALSADQSVGTLKTKISEIDSQIQIQRQELQPKHPEIVALQHQQQVYETQLRQRMGEIVGTGGTGFMQNVAYFRQVSNLDKARQDLANKLVNLQTQRERLAQELNILQKAEPELRRNYRDGTELKLDLEKRMKEVARDREAFDQTEKQLAAASLKKVETQSDWVTDGSPQVRDMSHWWLNRSVTLLAGGLLGVLVGGTAVLLLDLLRGRVLLPEEVQAILQQRVPFLGVLPSLPKAASKEVIPVLVEADLPYLDAYELFRSRLHRHQQDQSVKSVVVSSTRDNEGKTVSAYNLAIASARAGKKTLLIEANLRTPSQAQVVGLTPTSRETCDFSANGISMGNIQQTPGIKNLSVLPSLGSLEQVAEVLESSQTQQSLKSVRDDFDFVVIDATALRYSDALLIEPFTDGLVLVTRPGYTNRSSLRVVIEKLTEFSNIRLLGVVMNHVTGSTKYTHLLSL